MPEPIRIVVDGRVLAVAPGRTLAAALLEAGVTAFRRSVSGEPRGPVCGMGVCQECRVSVDGVPARRACLEPLRDGMEVRTG
jgi:sarcosine oxidase subunit alpha